MLTDNLVQTNSLGTGSDVRNTVSSSKKVSNEVGNTAGSKEAQKGSEARSLFEEGDTLEISTANPLGRTTDSQDDSRESEDQDEQSEEELQQLAEEVQSKLQENLQIRFGKDEETNTKFFQLVEKDSGEVVRQFPHEELIEAIKANQEASSLLFNDQA